MQVIIQTKNIIAWCLLHLSSSQGFIPIFLSLQKQGENFRETLKALQSNEKGQYENHNHILSSRLFQDFQTRQNQASNWKYFSGNDDFDFENQGYGSLVDHDRSTGLDCQHDGIGPGAHGSAMHGSVAEQHLTIVFSSTFIFHFSLFIFHFSLLTVETDQPAGRGACGKPSKVAF